MVIVLCVYFLLVFSRSLCPLYFAFFESFCHFLFYFDSHSHVSSVMLIVFTFLFLGCSPFMSPVHSVVFHQSLYVC